VFGVKRLSDEHCQENKIASKQFFTKFPSLHSFLLSELDSATLPLEEEKWHPIITTDTRPINDYKEEAVQVKSV